jgi:hypothetical protein
MQIRLYRQRWFCGRNISGRQWFGTFCRQFPDTLQKSVESRGISQASQTEHFAGKIPDADSNCSNQGICLHLCWLISNRNGWCSFTGWTILP